MEKDWIISERYDVSDLPALVWRNSEGGSSTDFQPLHDEIVKAIYSLKDRKTLLWFPELLDIVKNFRSPSTDYRETVEGFAECLERHGYICEMTVNYGTEELPGLSKKLRPRFRSFLSHFTIKIGKPNSIHSINDN